MVAQILSNTACRLAGQEQVHSNSFDARIAECMHRWSHKELNDIKFFLAGCNLGLKQFKCAPSYAEMIQFWERHPSKTFPEIEQQTLVFLRAFQSRNAIPHEVSAEAHSQIWLRDALHLGEDHLVVETDLLQLKPSRVKWSENDKDDLIFLLAECNLENDQFTNMPSSEKIYAFLKNHSSRTYEAAYKLAKSFLHNFIARMEIPSEVLAKMQVHKDSDESPLTLQMTSAAKWSEKEKDDLMLLLAQRNLQQEAFLYMPTTKQLEEFIRHHPSRTFRAVYTQANGFWRQLKIQEAVPSKVLIDLEEKRSDLEHKVQKDAQMDLKLDFDAEIDGWFKEESELGKRSASLEAGCERVSKRVAEEIEG